MKYLMRIAVISFLLFSFFVFFYGDFSKYLTVAYLAQQERWMQNHYVLSVGFYMTCYIVLIALSIPSKIFLNIAGGFLFGIWPGMLYAVTSATVGSTLIFVVIKMLFPTSQKIPQAKAFSYLLGLRLLPIFPFFVVNIGAGLSSIRPLVFVNATWLGILPCTFIYFVMGEELRKIGDSPAQSVLDIILQPSMLLALLGFALLILLPFILARKRSWETAK